jgi:hypothetical protein
MVLAKYEVFGGQIRFADYLQVVNPCAFFICTNLLQRGGEPCAENVRRQMQPLGGESTARFHVERGAGVTGNKVHFRPEMGYYASLTASCKI